MRRYLLLLTFTCLIYFGCSENTVGVIGTVSTTFALSGRVVDPQGAPIEGVGVHYIYYLDPVASVHALAKSMPTVSIEFCMTEQADVTLSLLEYGSREHIMTLVDNELFDEGCHSAQFSGDSLTNGLYIIHLSIGNSLRERLLAFLVTEVDQLVLTKPLTTTTSQGKFSLQYSSLGIGVILTNTDFNGHEYNLAISTTIDLVLYKEGYRPLVTRMTINPLQSENRIFRLEHDEIPDFPARGRSASVGGLGSSS
ncbi:MAG TPA: hypothetical protein VGR15_10405 [Bacteroidota bacterium]|jgi:hypothetical protein|nr:hypothetical protein [Bacteroidota bacterium]